MRGPVRASLWRCLLGWRVTVTRSLCAVWSGVHRGWQTAGNKKAVGMSFSPRTGRKNTTVIAHMRNRERAWGLKVKEGPNDSWHFNMIFWKWLHNQYICENVWLKKVIYFQVFLKMCFKLPPFTKYSSRFSSHDVYSCFGGNQASFKEVSKAFRWQEVACVCASEITSRRWLSVQFRYLHQLELWLPLSGGSSFLLRGFALKERKAPGGCFCRTVFKGAVIPNLHIYVSQPLTQVLLSLNFLFF